MFLNLMLMSGGMRGIPGKEYLSAYFKIVDGDVTDSIGLSGITITRVSGVDASDLVVTVAGATAYGIAESTEYTWVEFQDLCLASGSIFAGKKGCLVYSADQSSIGTRIISWLGGLYVAPDVLVFGTDPLLFGTETVTF